MREFARRAELGEMLLAIAVVIGAVTYLHADMSLSAPQIGDPMGPRAFPALIGVGLLVSGLLLFAEAWRKRRADAAGGAATRVADPVELRSWRVLAAMAAWTALYDAAFERAGYIVATLVYMFALLAWFNRGRWVLNAACAGGFTLAIYALFTRFLQVALPAGFLDF